MVKHRWKRVPGEDSNPEEILFRCRGCGRQVRINIFSVGGNTDASFEDRLYDHILENRDLNGVLEDCDDQLVHRIMTT